MRSLRARAAVGAVLVVGLALVVGSVAMIVLTRSSLTGNVREAAELRAEDVATALEGGAATPADLAVEDAEDGFIQVLDADGSVVDASPNVTGDPAVARLDDETSTVVGSGPVGDDRFVVVGIVADTPEGTRTVLVGRALDGADEATAALLRVLVVGVPLLLTLVGLVAWRLVGRALRPVAAMTATADEITATAPDRRLPEAHGADEFVDLARTLNAMLDRLAAARDRQQAFVADAAHELRSPVSSLRQHAEVTLAHPSTTTAPELAGVVQQESLRLQRLVDDLLLLTRADARQAPSLGPVDLAGLVDDVVARPRPAGPAVERTGGSPGPVTGAADDLERLVTNLVDNAVRHARSLVRVGLAADQGVAVLTVDDDGPGIEPADRERVFERFVRLDEARSRDAGGSGLGLAIVAAVAATHGGTVAVEDGPLGGARFRVTLPVAVPGPAPG